MLASLLCVGKLWPETKIEKHPRGAAERSHMAELRPAPIVAVSLGLASATKPERQVPSRRQVGRGNVTLTMPGISHTRLVAGIRGGSSRESGQATA